MRGYGHDCPLLRSSRAARPTVLRRPPSPGQVLCPVCRALFDHVLAAPAPEGLIACGAVFSCARYEDHARSAVLRWKDHGDAEAGWLSPIAGSAGCGRCHSRRSRACVWPVPSSWRSVRRRGRAHILELTRPLVRDLRRRGFAARQVCVITMAGRQRRSVTRSHERQRQERSLAAFRLRPAARRLEPGEAVILVDDICTTGSTLLACAHVLADAGHRPLAALTLASVADPARTVASTRMPAFRREVFG